MVFKLAFVTEYAKDLKEMKWIFPERAQNILNLVVDKGHDVYVLGPDEIINNSFTIKSISVNRNRIETIDIRDFDSIHCCWAGKPIEKLKKKGCLSEELPFFCKLMQLLTSAGDESPLVLNPIPSMLYNITKRYYFDLKNKLPFLPSTYITCEKQLLDFARGKKTMIAKPLISERSKGVVILNNLTDNEISQYFEKYRNKKQKSLINFEKDKLYRQIMSRQGIIVQPYSDIFVKYGEKKIYILDGKVHLARKVVGQGNGKIVAFYKGSQEYNYEPSAKEKQLAEQAFYLYNNLHPIRYMRLDIISSDENLFVNEIEVINPDWSEIEGTHLPEQLKKFRDAMYQQLSCAIIQNRKKLNQKHKVYYTKNLALVPKNNLETRNLHIPIKLSSKSKQLSNHFDLL